MSNLERWLAQCFRQRNEVIVIEGIELVDRRVFVDTKCRRDVDRVLWSYAIVPNKLPRVFGGCAVKLANNDPLMLKKVVDLARLLNRNRRLALQPEDLSQRKGGSHDAKFACLRLVNDHAAEPDTLLTFLLKPG